MGSQVWVYVIFVVVVATLLLRAPVKRFVTQRRNRDE